MIQVAWRMWASILAGHPAVEAGVRDSCAAARWWYDAKGTHALPVDQTAIKTTTKKSALAADAISSSWHCAEGDAIIASDRLCVCAVYANA